MKKLSFLLLLLSVFTMKAQDFPGKMPELLKGKQVTVAPYMTALKEGGYHNFFTNSNCTKNYASKTSLTPFDKLQGRVFMVEDIQPSKYGSAYVITLKEKDGKETIYYKYYSGSETGYYFWVEGGLDLPADFYADKVTKKIQDNGSTSYTTDAISGIRIQKVVYNDGMSPTYLATVLYTTPNVYKDAKKVALRFGNKTTIVKDDCNVNIHAANGGGYMYSTVLLFTNEEFELFKQSKLIGIDFETETRDVDGGGTLMGMVKYADNL